jgi:ACS family hexuronate transporter-like MFS transporter
MKSSSVPGERPHSIPAGSRIRVWITALLFFSTVINYLDRQNLSILARTIQDDLHISDLQYGYVIQAFLFAYTLSYIVAGRVTDKLGTRASMAFFVIWWSIADMCTSLSRGARSMGFFRFLLGIGEPGNYTAAPRAVSEWFEPRQSALIIGIYTAGATLGATLAPPLVALLATHLGWRPVFLCTGGLGLLWVIPWLLIYRDAPAPAASDPALAPPAHPWREVLRRREVWVLTLSRVITDPVWYFYLFWFPKYLTDSRHLTLTQMARIGWIVYLAADIGCITGGFLSGKLVQRGWSPVSARIRVMSIAVFLLPMSALVPWAPSPILVVLAASAAAFAHLAWQTSLSAMVVDIFPKPLIGTVFGIVAAGSGLGGMIFTNVASHVLVRYSYTPVFVAMGLFHPVAFLLIRRLRTTTTA